MVTCEMCGSTANSLFTVKIAGSNMSVCNSCKKMGKEVVNYDDYISHTFKRRSKTKITEEVIPNFASKVQSAMAKKGLNVHQLARVVNIRESSLNQYLAGKIKPDILEAKKLEKFLDIILIEEVENDVIVTSNIMTSEDERLSGNTIGDLLKNLKLDK